jgi:hypothetical protein
MASQDETKGEGFEILGHEAPKEAEPKERAAGSPGEVSGEAEKVAALDVWSVLRICVAQLAGIAWQMMGLQPDPFTNTVRKDMAQARVAIDAAAALVEQLLPHLQGQEAKDYQVLLTDLRLNFVTHSEGKTQ